MVWGSVLGFPGGIVRLTRDRTLRRQPWRNTTKRRGTIRRHRCGAFRRGGWTSMATASSGWRWPAAPASFDRQKCKGPLNGPKAPGGSVPKGGRSIKPGPKFKNVTASGSADSHYYVWVDRFDTLGLGKNTPIITGNSSDSLIALVNEKFTIMRVPYPMGFFAKGMDGRFDDPKAGWKGKEVWTTWGTRTPFHSETGKGTHPKVVHFQIRPDPLAY